MVMEIKLSRNRRQEASLVIGVFILLMLLLFFGGFLTFGCRAHKIKPRQLPPEDTNAVNIIQMPWFALLAPTPQEKPPGSSSLMPLSCFTNELSFPWYPGMDGWLIVWRTDNWRDYVMLSYILYEDEDLYRTNDNGDIFQIIRFVDQYPLPIQAFYEGVILTNSNQ